MSLVTPQGDAIEIMGPTTLSDRQLLRGQDIAIVHMRGKGCTWKYIGKFLRMSASNAHYRYNRIPRDERDRYARLSPLG